VTPMLVHRFFRKRKHPSLEPRVRPPPSSEGYERVALSREKSSRALPARGHALALAEDHLRLTSDASLIRALGLHDYERLA